MYACTTDVHPYTIRNEMINRKMWIKEKRYRKHTKHMKKKRKVFNHRIQSTTMPLTHYNYLIIHIKWWTCTRSGNERQKYYTYRCSLLGRWILVFVAVELIKMETHDFTSRVLYVWNVSGIRHWTYVPCIVCSYSWNLFLNILLRFPYHFDLILYESIPNSPERPFVRYTFKKIFAQCLHEWNNHGIIS